MDTKRISKALRHQSGISGPVSNVLFRCVLSLVKFTLSMLYKHKQLIVALKCLTAWLWLSSEILVFFFIERKITRSSRNLSVSKRCLVFPWFNVYCVNCFRAHFCLFLLISVNRLHVKFRVLGNHAAAEVLKEVSPVTIFSPSPRFKTSIPSSDCHTYVRKSS